MKRPLALWAVFALGTTLVPLSTVAAHPNVDPAPTAAPGAALSTSGDYATDTFGDPWDFSNDDDVPPVYQLIGSENSAGIVRNANAGTLTVSSRNNSTIKLVRTWGLELPWGRDGLLHPVAAATYSKISFSMCIAQPLHMAVDYWNTANEMGLHPFYPTAGCHIYDIDLRDISSNPPGYQTPWTGSMIRVELLRGGTPSGTDPLVDPLVDITLDWVRLRRSDAPRDPPAGLPLPQVLSPNEQGGTDVATAAGNPWDFASLADIYEIGKDVRVDGLGPGGIYGVTQGNDPYIEMRLPAPLDPDRYHRATIDVCNYGAMSFANAPGGGMNGRLAWLPVGGPAWSETQDIIIYPGCNTMTIDLATTPAGAVNDENTVFKRGWRGQRIARLRYDLNEDPGVRSFTLRSVKLADDASFASTFPITFTDAAGSCARHTRRYRRVLGGRTRWRQTRPHRHRSGWCAWGWGECRCPERDGRSTHGRGLHHHLAHRRIHAHCVDAQLRAGPHRCQSGAGEGGCWRQGVAVQLCRFHPPRGRCGGVLLGIGWPIRSGHTEAARRHSRRHRCRPRTNRAGPAIHTTVG